MAVFKYSGALFGSPHNLDHSIVVFVLAPPVFWQLPNKLRRACNEAFWSFFLGVGAVWLRVVLG